MAVALEEIHLKNRSIGVVAVLAVSAFAAFPAWGKGGSTPAGSLAVDESGYRLLFYRLKGVDLAKGPATVEFDVRVDRAPLLREALEVSKQEGAVEPAVELLGWTPERLKLLYEKAEAGSDVAIDVFVNGSLADSFSLRRLVEYNRDLLKTGLRPVSATPVITHASGNVVGYGSRAAAASGPIHTSGYIACTQTCWNNWRTCDSFCLSRPRPNCEENCEARYNLCMANCECPTTSDSTAVTIIPQTYTGQACVQDGPNSPTNAWFDRYTSQYKTTTTRRTENCDGSVTYTVVNVTYSAGPYCYRQPVFPSSCSFREAYWATACIFY
jgi:hypothetical protein